VTAENIADSVSRTAWVVLFGQYCDLRLAQVTVVRETELSYILKCRVNSYNRLPLREDLIGNSAGAIRRVTPKDSLIYFTYAQAVTQALLFLSHRIPILRVELEEAMAMQRKLYESQA